MVSGYLFIKLSIYIDIHGYFKGGLRLFGERQQYHHSFSSLQYKYHILYLLYLTIFKIDDVFGIQNLVGQVQVRGTRKIVEVSSTGGLDRRRMKLQTQLATFGWGGLRSVLCHRRSADRSTSLPNERCRATPLNSLIMCVVFSIFSIRDRKHFILLIVFYIALV